MKRFALEVLHRDERLALEFAHFIDRANVGMIEHRSGARFALESLARLLVAGQVFREEFQGNEAVE